MSEESKYPKDLFKQANGNLHHHAAADEAQEKGYRDEGFKTAEELWPTNPVKRKGK